MPRGMSICRFKRMIATRTEGIELLLNAGLKANPEKLAVPGTPVILEFERYAVRLRPDR